MMCTQKGGCLHSNRDVFTTTILRTLQGDDFTSIRLKSTQLQEMYTTQEDVYISMWTCTQQRRKGGVHSKGDVYTSRRMCTH